MHFRRLIGRYIWMFQFGSFGFKPYDWFIICSSQAYECLYDLVLFFPSPALYLVIFSLCSLLFSEAEHLSRPHFAIAALSSEYSLKGSASAITFWPSFCLINSWSVFTFHQKMSSLAGNLYWAVHSVVSPIVPCLPFIFILFTLNV